MKSCRLQYARILLQTSCSCDEVSYGSFFTPLFCWLQCHGERVISEASRRIAEENFNKLITQQSPTFFDSEAEHDTTQYPVVGHECGGNTFYFFNDLRIFHNAAAYMCVTRSRELTRGIPPKRIYDFFRSIVIDSPEKPKIVSCKLITISNGTPLALFLVEWQALGKFYHLHIHFYGFDNMVVSRVTHVDVTEESDIYRPHFTEESDIYRPHFTEESDIYRTRFTEKGKKIHMSR